MKYWKCPKSSKKTWLFKIIVGVANKIDKVVMDFTWGSWEEGEKDHLVNWEIISLPREKGGLDIINVFARNITLLESVYGDFPLSTTHYGIPSLRAS